MKSISFEPIVSKKSKILILGTMPGIKSLQEQQYYAHERNAFWNIIFRIFDEQFSTLYEKRKELILKNGLAIWDTLKYCYREGSLDSNIKNAEPNKVNELLNQNKQIKSVVFNGQSAQKFYDKFHDRIDGITYHCLPSTSPANARLKIEDKYNEWAVIKDLL